MFLKTLPAEKNGNQMMYYAKSKRIHTGYKINENGRRVKTYKIRAEVIKYIGYVHEFKDQYDDPIEHFKAEAKRITEEENNKKKKKITTITIDLNERFTVNTSYIYYLGNLPILSLLNQIGLIRFINNKRRDSKAKFNHTHILQLMIYNRIINPSSIKQAYLDKDKYFDDFNFSLDDMYRALDLFLESKDRLIQTIHENIIKHYNRDTTLLFYNVTTLEINNKDDLKTKGISKDRTKLGLFMDDKGIPVTYDLFNANDTFPTMIDKVEFNLKLQNVVYIADKSIMGEKNIEKLILNHCGYVMSATIHKFDKDFKQYILDQDGYKTFSDSSDNGFKYKSRYYTKDICIENGSNSKVSVKERVIIIYSEKEARKARIERERKILKIKNLLIDKDNIFDWGKIREEEKYDGYYAIFTNVQGLGEGEKPFNSKAKWMEDGLLKLNKTVSDLDIIQMYEKFKDIKNPFEILKDEFKEKPEYLNQEQFTKSLFLLSFISSIIMKLLQKHSNFESVDKIRNSLSEYKCLELDENNYKLMSYKEPLNLISKSLNLELDKGFISKQDIKNLYGKARKL